MGKASFLSSFVVLTEISSGVKEFFRNDGVMRNNLVGITPQSSRVGIRDAVRPGPTPS
jgi:hypothetical protein